jgi:hypothetical protein
MYLNYVQIGKYMGGPMIYVIISEADDVYSTL